MPIRKRTKEGTKGEGRGRLEESVFLDAVSISIQPPTPFLAPPYPPMQHGFESLHLLERQSISMNDLSHHFVPPLPNLPHTLPEILTPFFLSQLQRWEFIKENTPISTKKATKNEKKNLSFFLDRFLGRVLVFFYKFPPLKL